MIGKNVKICLSGDEAVGKSSLIRRFIQDEFSEDYKRTVGFTISAKTIEIEDKSPVTFSVWDIGGDKTFLRVQKGYYEGVRGAFLVFDHTEPDSLANLLNWANFIREVEPFVPFILVGNKNDLEHKIPEEKIQEIKEKLDIVHYFSTSAKTGEQVDAIFTKMAQMLSVPGIKFEIDT